MGTCKVCHAFSLISVLVLLSLILSACGSPPAIPAPVVPQPTPRPPAFPVGRFTSVAAPSPFLLVIHNDRSFDVYLGNDLLDSGTFMPRGTQLVADSHACGAQRKAPALYDWAYDVEQGLAFEGSEFDACSQRQQYLSQDYVPSYLFIFHTPDGAFSRQWIW